MTALATAPRVALATYSLLPNLAEDDRLLIPALAQLGVRAEPRVWNDPTVDWASYTAVALRSAWDYHRDPHAFLAWIASLESAGVALVNMPDTVRWNVDKTYLRDLATAGVRTVPTRWIDSSNIATLATIVRETGWNHVVVKPAISASAHDTWRATESVTVADEERLRALAQRGTVLVQPYLDVVASVGELSLVFLDGTYSHAVLKRPRTGDFRVQTEHGGSVESATPGAHVVAQAQSVLRAAPIAAAHPAYARVDGVLIDDELVLMELELIEPGLFLSTHPHAPTRLARAIARRLPTPATVG